MVVLHVKRSEGNTFLVETHMGIQVGALIDQLVERKCIYFLIMLIVNNLRLKMDRASQSMEELAAKGPIKPMALRGLTGLDDYVKHEDLTVINGLKEMPAKTGVREIEDPDHYRTGWLLSEEMCSQMLAEAMKGKQLIHKT